MKRILTILLLIKEKVYEQLDDKIGKKFNFLAPLVVGDDFILIWRT
jgi:hypothetical protein